jgi:hypothetical protein
MEAHVTDDLIEITLRVEPALAADVTAFVRDRVGQGRASRTAPVSAPQGSTSVQVTGVSGDPWKPASYTVLRRRPEQSFVRVRRLLDVLSAQPEVGQTPDEAAVSTGYQASELRQALGRLTTLMNSSTDERNWPLIWNGTLRQWSVSQAQAHAWLGSATQE